MSDSVTLFLTIESREHLGLAQLHGESNHEDVEAALARIYGVSLPVRRLPKAVPVSARDEAFVATQPDVVVVGLHPIPKNVALGLKKEQGIRISVDLPIAPAEIWCPDTAASPLFGRLDRAKALIGAGALAPAKAEGAGVNVVIVDQGIDAAYLGNAILNNEGKPRGWKVTDGEQGTPTTRRPGEAAFGHGTKMALLVHDLAPKARIYDLPLLPPRIHSVSGFLSLAQTVMADLLRRIERDIALSTARRWVICNAWSVYDLSADFGGNEVASYADDPANPFTQTVAAIVAAGADVVFAAGNCGQYCPDGRCGTGQVGPGNSIYGVAALAEVLTVGAVRSDTTWLGYSSQGPAPAAFSGAQKPDLCAPSQFAGTSDVRIGYTGTSSSCALAAGAVAALRDRNVAWKGTPPDPGAMIAGLRGTAMLAPGAAQGDFQYGSGILDLAAFVAANTAPATSAPSAASTME